MTKNLFTLAILLIILFSCKSEEENNLTKMKDAIIKELNDNAFKENATLDILEYSYESYNIKDENYLDTIRLNINLDKIEYFKNMMETQIELMKPLSQQVRLYREMFGANDNITQIKIEDFKEEQEKFQQYSDSIKYCFEQDSLIKLRINQRTAAKPIYRYKAYIKAVLKDNNSNKTENFADTIYKMFDEKINIITY
ncbi:MULTISPECIES: hypothetical protein [Bacteroides]|jgi:hypothetical protein|uniref:Lipoprotein n=1 Tax=Bacteroides fragilis TaxID=817 RepID=A0A0I9USJ8_BACFG|nr:hypothetical protein [Bacteroides fragilis]DAZ13162.1 MAG TPA: hypothetical protein [Caudoviricetes sp.]MCE8567186.1 hypothetical protein [Bacteroides fragilis]MCM0197268.1 hypothetical protein [Bacteroides fragilis]MCM0198147.1 hypothetical protein [Bacteroides fragilis]MCM0208498.1 hypothetical protein [Bacteroides fragilis]